MEFAHPADLADRLHRGELDVALVPVFEAIEHPGYLAVEGCGIGCDGPVHSVFVAHVDPLKSLDRVRIDPASRTSVHLLRLLLRGASGPGVLPELPLPAELRLPKKGEGIFLIGNQALDYRREFGDQCSLWDLGEAWKNETGLPFVFALWLMRPDLPGEKISGVAKTLRACAEAGRRAIPELVQRQTMLPETEALEYLTEHIRYELDESSKAGLETYAERLSFGAYVDQKPEWRWV